MPLPRNFFAPSFRHRRIGWLFAAITGILVFLATFTMTAEATLSTVTLNWDSSMRNHLTVQIPAVGDEAGTSQAERVKQALSILRAMPQIDHADSLAEDETIMLLKPWFDQPELLKTLPLPTLIDVERKADSKLGAADIRQQLKSSIPDVHVDDADNWMANFARFVEGSTIMGGMMIGLTLLALVIAVSLLCRAIMATEQQTISLLHIMGAEDTDIAHHFSMHARRLTGPAAILGGTLALIGAGILLFFMRHNADPMTLSIGHWAGLAAAIIAVPLIAIWIAALSARLSVLNFLYNMP